MMRSLCTRLTTDREVRDAECTLSMRGADAVCARVSAADHDDVLARGGDLVCDLVASHGVIGFHQVFHREVHAVQVAPGDWQFARHG